MRATKRHPGPAHATGHASHYLGLYCVSFLPHNYHGPISHMPTLNPTIECQSPNLIANLNRCLFTDHEHTNTSLMKGVFNLSIIQVNNLVHAIRNEVLREEGESFTHWLDRTWSIAIALDARNQANSESQHMPNKSPQHPRTAKLLKAKERYARH